MEPKKDDALFEQLGKNKKRRRRKVIVTALTVILILAVLLVGLVIYLRRTVRERFASGTDQVQSYEVKTGTLSTVVSGSGTLAEDGLEAITVPEGVEVTKVLVKAGDTVAEGQILATVDAASVHTALASLQESLEALDKQISSAENDTVSASVTTRVAGRVKRIYAEKGQSVSDCMVEHGALAALSLDGYMAVTLQTDALAPGDAVTVIREDGTELSGTVERSAAGYATVLVTDDGPEYDEEVTVSLEGTVLGSGKLSIHEPLSVTGYAGTVQSVLVSENQRIYRGTGLFSLTDTSTSVTYDSLLRSRQEQEETLLELLTLRSCGGVAAPFAGSVYTVDYDETLAPGAVATLTPDEKMTVTLTVDESDILSLELGQEAEITVSSLGEEPFPGAVTELDRTGASGVYTAVITLDKTGNMLPGMTASVSIRISGVENAVLIPLEALQQTRSRSYVYTSYDEETETFGGEVDVTVGLTGSTEVEILSGLKPGDTVYYTKELTIADFFAGMSGMPMGGSGGMGSMPGGSQRGNGGSGGERPQGGFSGGKQGG